jgi:hypothetical protein
MQRFTGTAGVLARNAARAISVIERGYCENLFAPAALIAGEGTRGPSIKRSQYKTVPMLNGPVLSCLRQTCERPTLTITLQQSRLH